MAREWCNEDARAGRAIAQRTRSSSPQGGRADETRSSSPQGGSADDARSSSPQGGSADDARSSSPQGGSADDARSSSPQGGSADERAQVARRAVAQTTRAQVARRAVAQTTRAQVARRAVAQTNAPDIAIAASTDAEIGESPIWVADSQRLYWVDIAGRMIHAHDPATRANESYGAPDVVAIQSSSSRLRRRNGDLVPRRGDRRRAAGRHGPQILRIIDAFRFSHSRRVKLAIRGPQDPSAFSAGL